MDRVGAAPPASPVPSLPSRRQQYLLPRQELMTEFSWAAGTR